MKKLSNLFLSVTLCSVVLTTTACGKKANLVTPDFPQQQAVQPLAQYPTNNNSGLTNPAYQNQQSSYDYQNQTGLQQNTPSRSDLNNNSTYSSNTPTNNQNINTIPETVATVQPSSTVTTPVAPVKTPWYKKVINKVKSIFSKKTA